MKWFRLRKPPNLNSFSWPCCLVTNDLGRQAQARWPAAGVLGCPVRAAATQDKKLTAKLAQYWHMLGLSVTLVTLISVQTLAVAIVIIVTLNWLCCWSSNINSEGRCQYLEYNCQNMEVGLRIILYHGLSNWWFKQKMTVLFSGYIKASDIPTIHNVI